LTRLLVPAAAALVAALVAGGSGARAPVPRPCGSNGPSKGTPHAEPLQAPGAAPTTVDQHQTPQLAPGKPAKGKPHEIPQPSYERAKKLKAAKPDCVPYSPPTVPGPPKGP
jgi:hypothetical protein